MLGADAGDGRNVDAEPAGRNRPATSCFARMKYDGNWKRQDVTAETAVGCLLPGRRRLRTPRCRTKVSC